MKKTVMAVVLSASMFAGGAAQATLKGEVILRDTFYGALTGTLIGGAAMVFTDHPKDHFMYLAYGAALGAMGGAAFGVYESNAFVQYEDGTLYLATPTLHTRPVAGGLEGSAELLEVRF